MCDSTKNISKKGAGLDHNQFFSSTVFRKNRNWPGTSNLLKQNHAFSSQNFLYAASSPAPYSAVFFVGT
jgi:hypothetical protein